MYLNALPFTLPPHSFVHGVGLGLTSRGKLLVNGGMYLDASSTVTVTSASVLVGLSSSLAGGQVALNLDRYEIK